MQTRPAFALGGVAATLLAERYGTPLLVIDTDVLDRRIAAFASLGETFGFDIAYAAKAFLCVALVERLAATPLGLDVCSLGELAVAERAGFPVERITFHGCGKSDDELVAARAGRVGRIVVDHATELERLIALGPGTRRLVTLLRVNTGIEAHTHAAVRTGGDGTKFGFTPADADAAAVRVAADSSLRFGGFHAHLGSQIFDTEPYRASLAVLLERCAQASRSGIEAAVAIVGGGFGVHARPDAAGPDLAALAGELARTNARIGGALGVAPRLGLEPGRSLVAEAGTTLYRTIAVKRHGSRRFAIVDGSLADNPRPALYGAYHHPVAVDHPASPDGEETTVCGRSCENDRLVVAPLPAAFAAGDLLALQTTGAYTFSMASNYNRFPRPAVVFAGAGEHRLAVRRETPDDLLRTDCHA